MTIGEYFAFREETCREKRVSELRTRVARGILELDRSYRGWFRKIDPHTLDIASSENCVLGQIFGRFADGVRLLSGREMFGTWYAEERGFMADLGSSHFASDSGILTDLWVLVIRERLEAVHV